MVDILPTLLELAEIEVNHTHFGQSLNHVLANPGNQHRQQAFSEGGFTMLEADLLEQPQGEYKQKGALQRSQPDLVGRTVALRNERYTYVYRLYEEDEFYDRIADPEEQTNLFNQPDQTNVKSQLRDEILNWLLATADTIPWSSDPRFPRVPNGYHDQL